MRHISKHDDAPPEVKDDLNPQNVNVIHNDLELDGTVSVVTRGKAMNAAELCAKACVGPEWIPTHHRHNEWQSSMKLKVEGSEKPIIIQMHGNRTSFKRIMGEELQEAILDWTKNNVKAAKAPVLPNRKTVPGEKYMVSWGISDAHLGMYAFAKEVGADYDVDIAYNRCLNSIDDMVDELSGYRICKILMPIGNDFMHFDNVRRTTSGSDIVMDTDSRFARVYRAATRVLEYMVRRASEIADHVDVFYVPGNHDVLTSYTLTCWLAALCKDYPNVTVDLNENPQKFRSHGGVTIMYEHGKDIAPRQFPLIFNEWASHHGIDLNKITYREVQIGHWHQKRVREFESEIPMNGLAIVTNPALCNADHYHHTRGLTGVPMKSVEARRYDKVGVRGTHVTWARDDERPK